MKSVKRECTQPQSSVCQQNSKHQVLAMAKIHRGKIRVFKHAEIFCLWRLLLNVHSEANQSLGIGRLHHHIIARPFHFGGGAMFAIAMDWAF